MPLPTILLDLGFATGRIDEAENGEPNLLIFNPVDQGNPAQSVVVSGWDAILGLAAGIDHYYREHHPEQLEQRAQAARQFDQDFA